MSEKNTSIALSYYQAMNDKNSAKIEPLLHPEIDLISPFAEIHGKEHALNTIKNFFPVFKEVAVRTVCSSGNDVMVAYTVHCPFPIGPSRAAAWITFENGLIKRYELFYDTQPFTEKKDEIFQKA